MNTKTLTATSLSFLALASSALANGFALSEMSARGNGLQGTLVGSTKDVSAIYYNPANLTELEPTGVYTLFGITLARPDFHVRAGGTVTDQDESVFPLPHLYVGGALTDELYLGLGIYTEYGLGTCYERGNKWVLASDSMKTKIVSFTTAPVLAWKATDYLSFAAGPRIMYMNFIQDRYVAPYRSNFHLDAEDWTCAYQLAASWKIIDTLGLGLVYRSKAEFHEEGDVTLRPLGVNSGVKGDVTMPQSVTAGLNWQATDRLGIGFAATWTDWSSFDGLTMKFSNEALPTTYARKDWHSCWRYSFGLEYQLNDNWSVQAGYTYDGACYNSDYPDTMCPPGARDQISFGFQYKTGAWTFGADYMLVHIRPTDRTIGDEKVSFRELRTDTFGFSMGYHF